MEEENRNNVRLIIRAKNNLLLEKREGLGFTQQQMADYCDLALTHYSKAERLEYIPFAQAEKLALILEMGVEQLFPNWSNLFGEIINSKNSYLLVDNSYIQKRIENNEAFGSQKLLAESFHTDLDFALESLPKRNAEAIKLYFGIGGGKPMTLGELGEKLNVTRERARQIKEKALRSLRYSKRSGILSKYLCDSLDEIG